LLRINGMTLPAPATWMRGKDQHAGLRRGQRRGRETGDRSTAIKALIMMKRRPPHGLSKAELRAAGAHAVAQASKPIVKLPTKLVRQCGRCGEFCSVMVEPGQPAPEFKCKVCDRP
jgi:hypothetical protein